MSPKNIPKDELLIFAQSRETQDLPKIDPSQKYPGGGEDEENETMVD